MKLVDVNVLVYAINLESPHHALVRAWWEETLRSGEKVALTWTTVSGFIRVTTQSHAVNNPLAVDEALKFVDDWLEHPNVQIALPREDHLRIFSMLLKELGRGGNLTTDAHLAAIAIGNGAVLASCDTDFARFSKLRWENPLAASG